MKLRLHLLIPLTCAVVVLGMGAGRQVEFPAQSGPFPTVPPPNATFQPPIQAGPTAQPGFFPFAVQPDLDLGARLRKAAGYMVAGVASLALGAAALWANRDKAQAPSVLSLSGTARFGPSPRRFNFRPRLRRLTWIIPSGAGLVLLGLAATKCVPPKVCYATVGGVEIVVPCYEAEAQAQAKPTATEYKPECGDDLDPLLGIARRGRSGDAKIWEIGANNPAKAALEWFYSLVEPGSVVPHRNVQQAQLGGLEGRLRSGNGDVFYRPKSDTGGPAIDIGSHNRPECNNLKFHFETGE